MPEYATSLWSLPFARRLFLPTYKVADAARYLGTHPRTVSAWHNGNAPVLPGHMSRKPLSYLELVETAFVNFFRRAGVTMPRIRRARDYIASRFTTEAPLAAYQFKTEGMHILMDYNQFDPDSNVRWEPRVVVTDQMGQLGWSDLMGEVFSAFDYEEDLAIRWYPAGRESLVVIDPRVSFGAPVVQGLPTWVIKGRVRAGEQILEIVDDFGISEKAVRDALDFERMPEMQEA